MQKPKIGLITFGHTYFDPLADKAGLIESIKAAWSNMPFTLVPFPEIPKDVAGTVKATEFFEEQRVNGIVINGGAYGFENLAIVLGLNTSLPLLVWSPHQAAQGLIPTTTFFATMANLKHINRQIFPLVGNMDSLEVKEGLSIFSKTCLAVKMLRRATLGVVGAHCPGMMDTTFSEFHIRRFIPGILSLDTQDILDAMAAVNSYEIKQVIEKIKATFGGLMAEESQMAVAARSYIAMKNVVKAYSLDAITIRCWPELSKKGFSGILGSSFLFDEGTICMLERDVPATATALAFYYLTGQPSYIGEIDCVDAAANQAHFVNDNSMPASLVSSKAEHQVVAGDIFIYLTTGKPDGLNVKGTLKSGPITLTKLQGTPKDGNPLAMGITTGEVVPFTPKEGTLSNAHVTFKRPINDFLYQWAKGGFEHHMVINHTLVVKELTMLCEIMGVTPELI
jgi:L-fucose isomerase-like protein